MRNTSAGGKARAEKLSKEERTEIAKKGALTRWGFKSHHKGSFSEDFGIDADCYVLDDELGTAVLTQRGTSKILGFSNDNGKSFTRLVNRESVKKLIAAKTLEKLENPLKFQYVCTAANTPNFVASGYDATVIIDVCNAVIKASRQDNGIAQETVANAAIIIGACAKLGIRELIYKLAGYNSTKAQVVAAFRQFVSEEASKWAKEFPDDLYEEWQRIYQIPVPERGKNWEHRHLTLRHIYTPLAKSNGRLLDLLREAKGEQRSKKLHQFLSEVGKDSLRAHIWKVVGIASGSRSKEDYERSIARAFGGQLPLDLEGE